MIVESNKTLLDGLNNAIIAYDEVIWAIKMCCDIPSRLAGLKSLSEEELDKRRGALVDLYLKLKAECTNQGSCKLD